MLVALDLAAIAASLGEVPVGAVVTKGGVILARAHNLRETHHDPTAHAELVAIRQAAAALVPGLNLVAPVLGLASMVHVLGPGVSLPGRIGAGFGLSRPGGA